MYDDDICFTVINDLFIKVERIPPLIPDDAFHYTVMTDSTSHILETRIIT